MCCKVENGAGFALGALIAVGCTGLVVYAAKHFKARMTDPLLNPDWSLKLKVRQLFEAGKPAAGRPVWGSDWEAFTKYLLEEDKTIGTFFKQRYGAVQRTVENKIGGQINFGGIPIWNQAKFGTTHSENQIFSTLANLSRTTHDQLFVDAKWWLTLTWGVGFGTAEVLTAGLGVGIMAGSTEGC